MELDEPLPLHVQFATNNFQGTISATFPGKAGSDRAILRSREGGLHILSVHRSRKAKGQAEMTTLIAQHGMIGSGRTNAFIDEAGTLRRLSCHDERRRPLDLHVPTDPGISSIEVEDARIVTQSYRAGTTILDTYFSSCSGSVKLTDFMPVALPGPGEPEAGTSDGVCARIVRFLTCTRGSARGRIVLWHPAEKADAAPLRDSATVWHLSLTPMALRLEGAQDIHATGQGLAMDFVLKAGEQAHFALTCEPDQATTPVRSVSAARKALAQCNAYWRNTPASENMVARPS